MRFLRHLRWRLPCGRYRRGLIGPYQGTNKGGERNARRLLLIKKETVGSHMEYSVEKLYNETEVLISPEHRFGTDAMLLSGFCRPRREEEAVDLCSGCGIVSLRWHDLGHRGPCKAVELDPRGTALLKEAVNRQNISHIEPVCMDLNELKNHPTAHIVAANPPYFTGGFVSPDAARATARHEGGCTLEQVADAAWRLLRDGGRFALCHRPEHLSRVCSILSARGLEPKRLCFAKQGPTSAPWLFLLEAQKGRKPGIRYEPDIFMADETGRPSRQLQKIYNEGM